MSRAPGPACERGAHTPSAGLMETDRSEPMRRTRPKAGNTWHYGLMPTPTQAQSARPPEAIGRLLRADVRLARLDHRIGLAARRAQRGRGRGAGVDPVVDARGVDAVAARADVRRARRDLPGRRRRGPRSRTTSHGPIAGFTAGWASWLQAVFIAPIEVLAAITYVNSVDVGARALQHDHTRRTPACSTAPGSSSRSLLMIAVHRDQPDGREVPVGEQRDRRDLEDGGAVPRASVVVGVRSSTPPTSTRGGGFMPFGFHGVFAALTGGVVFGLQGFEQAVQLAGEARDPKRDLSRAIITAMAIGAVLYALLQIVMIGGLEPANIARAAGHKPLGTDPVGVRRLVHARARARRRLAREGAADRRGHLAGGHRHRLRRHDGASVVRARRGARDAERARDDERARACRCASILVAVGRRLPRVRAVQELERARQRGHRRDRDHVRVRAGVARGAAQARWRPAALVPDAGAARVLLPAGVLLGEPDHLLGRLRHDVEARAARCCSGSCSSRSARARVEPTRRARCATRMLDRAVARRPRRDRRARPLRTGATSILPSWVDIGVVIAFALAIFYWAVSLTMTKAETAAAIAKDADQINYAA